MRFLLDVDAIKVADQIAINEYGIPSAVLMENAARSVADFIKHDFPSVKRIKVFCGAGNNGGDGFAVARHLFSDYNVEVYFLGNAQRMSVETQMNYDIVQKMKIPLYKLENIDSINSIDTNCDIIIDALIGIGGGENLVGDVTTLLRRLNKSKAVKIAVDIPSGLNANTGAVSDSCFVAEYTVTMFSEKLGMHLLYGSEVCGTIIAADLGAPFSIIQELSSSYILEEEDIPYLIPERERNTSKFDYGRVIVVAGSNNFPGAAALVTNAAVKSGAGLVELISPTLHSSILPEIIYHKAITNNAGFMTNENLELTLERLEKANTLVIGPGIGNDAEVLDFVTKVINNAPAFINVVIDADALRVVNNLNYRSNKMVLTPHIIEFNRMFDLPMIDVQRRSFEIVKSKAKELNSVILLKNVPSIITDGTYSFLNIAGNPGMATGGSGDVLSGVIGSLMAQGLDSIDAAAAGAYIHSKAGDLYVADYSMQSLTASNLVEYLKVAF